MSFTQRVGGGFVSSQGGGNSPGSKRGSNSLRPVTIAMIVKTQLPHPDADMVIHGKEIGQVTFVGTVRTVSRHATHSSLTVEDGTGCIDVRKWADSDSIMEDEESGMDEEEERNKLDRKKILNNDYVRVLGTIKEFNNKRHINSTSVRIIHNDGIAEAFFHQIEVIHVKMCLLHGLPRSRQGAGTDAAGRQTLQASQSGGSIQGGGGNQASDYSRRQQGNNSAAAQVDISDAYADLPPVQGAVMRYVNTIAKSSDGIPEEGVNVGEIVRGLKSNQYGDVGGGVGEETIKQAATELATEGYLFEGGDGDHWLPTE